MMATNKANEASKRVISETSRLYEDLLAREPPFNEKQLARPTFKLIQEIVKSLITETRTLRNVFNPSDFGTDNKTWDKRRKIEFIQKLIDFAANHKQPVVGCVAAKIVAGLEANKTNELLQSLARIAQARINGQENNNPNRPRTFTKQLPLGATISPAPELVKSATYNKNPPKGPTQQQVAYVQRARGLAPTNRRVSGDRPSRGTSGASTRNASANSAASASSRSERASSLLAASDHNNQVGAIDQKSPPPQQVRSADNKLERNNAHELIEGDSRVGSGVKDATLAQTPALKVKKATPSQSYHEVTSESDIGKHMLQLRSNLRILGPILMDISKCIGDLKERLPPEDIQNDL